MKKLTVLFSTILIYCCSIVSGQTADETLAELDKLTQKTDKLIDKLDENIQELKLKSKQKNGIFALGGYSENGYGLLAGFKYFPNKSVKRYYEISGYAGSIEEKQTRYNIPIEVYSLNIGYFVNIQYLSSKTSAFQFYVGAGGTIGNESINDSKIQLQPLESISTNDGTIYGVYGAMEADIKFFKNLSGIVRYTHFYHPNSDIGKTKFLLGIGLIFKF